MTKVVRMIGKIVMVCSVIPLVCFSLAYFQTTDFLKKSVETQATVQGFEQDTLNDNRTIFFPTFSYQDKTGQTFTVTAGWGSLPGRYQVGEKIPILFDSENPEKAVENRLTAIWFGTILAAIFLGIFWFSGVFLLTGAPLFFWFMMRSAQKTG